MSKLDDENLTPGVTPGATAGGAGAMPDGVPVKEPVAGELAGIPEARRDFFSHAMREAMGPVAGFLEKRINPFLNAMEQLPGDVDAGLASVDRLGGGMGRRVPLDQLGAGDAGVIPAALKMPARLLRPPGAGEEFSSQCSRCGKCVEVCPASAIKMDASFTIGNGLPFIVATEMPCVVCDSLACMNECPTHALHLLEKLDIDMGTAKVDHATCLRTVTGEPCQLCVDACPLGDAAITIAQTSGRVHVRINGCIGCGICEQRCPTEPRSIVVLPREFREEPIVA